MNIAAISDWDSDVLVSSGTHTSCYVFCIQIVRKSKECNVCKEQTWIKKNGGDGVIMWVAKVLQKTLCFPLFFFDCANPLSCFYFTSRNYFQMNMISVVSDKRDFVMDGKKTENQGWQNGDILMRNSVRQTDGHVCVKAWVYGCKRQHTRINTTALLIN